MSEEKSNQPDKSPMPDSSVSHSEDARISDDSVSDVTQDHQTDDDLVQTASNADTDPDVAWPDMAKPPQTKPVDRSRRIIAASPDEAIRAAKRHTDRLKPIEPPQTGQLVSDNNQTDQPKNTESGKSAEQTESVERPATLPQREPSDQRIHDTAILSRESRALRRAIASQSPGSEEPATLGEQREVILVIRGMVERVVMVEDVAFKLGRFELGSRSTHEIDLTPYGALDRGVSRLHAELRLKNDHLYVTDLGSTNGTYLAGKKLEPDTPTMLRKGDELLVGRLAIQVLFR